MINNLELIKPLLTFVNKGDFYMINVLVRKKDQPEGEKQNTQSARMIKTYCVESIDYLEKKYDEIIKLCELFKARAYIYVQRHNHKDVSLSLMELLAKRIKSGSYNQSNIFESVVAQEKVYEKLFMIDVDTKDSETMHKIYDTIFYLQPIENKVKQILPTKMGFHIITKPFNREEFHKNCPDVEVKKNSPVLLYC